MKMPKPMMCRAVMAANIKPARRRSPGVSAPATWTRYPRIPNRVLLPAFTEPAPELADTGFIDCLLVRELIERDCWDAGQQLWQKLERSRLPTRGSLRAAHCRGAIGTQADDRKVNKARAVAELKLDQLAYPVELLGSDSSIVRAALTCEVLPVPGHGQRVEAPAVAEVHMANDADVLERLQVAVDRPDV